MQFFIANPSDTKSRRVVGITISNRREGRENVPILKVRVVLRHPLRGVSDERLDDRLRHPCGDAPRHEGRAKRVEAAKRAGAASVVCSNARRSLNPAFREHAVHEAHDA